MTELVSGLRWGGGKRLGTACLAALLVAGGAFPAAIAPAGAKFKTKTKDQSTVDPAVNHFKEATTRLKKLDIDGAIDEYLQATYFARNNYHPAAYYGLGICYKLKKEDAKAIDAFKKHLEQNVGASPDAHVELAEIYMRQNRDREAEQELNTALYEYFGPGPRAHNMLGKLKEKKGQYADAVYQYEQALGDQPWMYAEAWMNLAEALMRMHNYGAAIQHCTNMLARGKTLPFLDEQRVLLDLGLSCFNIGDHQGALNNWHQVLKINPDNPFAHLYLGMMFDKESHMSSAVTEYKAFLRLAPDDKGAQKVRDRVLALEQKIKPVEAEPAAAKPTPYMRQEMEDRVSRQRAMEEQVRRAMDNLEQLGQKAGDSGF